MLENNIKFASFADIFAAFLVVLMFLLLVVAISPDEYPQPNATTALLGKSSLSLFALFLFYSITLTLSVMILSKTLLTKLLMVKDTGQSS